MMLAASYAARLIRQQLFMDTIYYIYVKNLFGAVSHKL